MIDRLTGRVTMYRLATIALIVVAVAAFVAAALGELDAQIFTPAAMAVSLLVLVAAVTATSVVGARLVGSRAHVESSLITALLLWFLFWPSTTPVTLAWFAGIGALAGASKFLLAVHGRHVVNPAAAGVVLAALIGHVVGGDAAPRTTWWVASESLLPFVAVGALLVLHRTRRLALGLTFLAVASALSVGALLWVEVPFGDAWQFTLVSSPLVFFAGFMLSEPLTLPPRRRQQVAVAAVAGVVVTWPVVSGNVVGRSLVVEPFDNLYAVALVVTGLVAYACGQRGTRWTFTQRRDLGGEIAEYRFRADRDLPFVPGQYVEVHVPHRSDVRGTRRMFSLVHAPGEDPVIAVREPQPGSSFKRALAALAPGDRVAAVSVHGDFVWPRDTSRPLLLVAGGIGVTPFVSQLSAHPGRDVVVVLGVRDASAVPYADELAEAATLHVVVGDVLTAGHVADLVPDLAQREAFVSGTPAMVDAIASGLRGRAASVRTDHFLGY